MHKFIISKSSSSSNDCVQVATCDFVDSSSGKAVWTDSSMTEEAGFAVTSDPLVNRKNQKEALLKIARLLSQRIYNKTVERF